MSNDAQQINLELRKYPMIQDELKNEQGTSLTWCTVHVHLAELCRNIGYTYFSYIVRTFIRKNLPLSSSFV
jgi:hypothetical protein